MKKLIIIHALVLSIFSSLAFAEGGGDRVFERNEARAHKALAAREKTGNHIQNTVKSETKTKTKTKTESVDKS